MGEQVRNLVQKHPTVSSVEECADAVIELVMENRRERTVQRSKRSNPLFCSAHTRRK